MSVLGEENASWNLLRTSRSGVYYAKTTAEKTIDEAPMACIEIIKKPGNKCKYLLPFYI